MPLLLLALLKLMLFFTCYAICFAFYFRCRRCRAAAADDIAVASPAACRLACFLFFLPRHHACYIFLLRYITQSSHAGGNSLTGSQCFCCRHAQVWHFYAVMLYFYAMRYAR